MPVPVWVIILAVLAGLLLLAVLVFVMYRVSNEFWKRGSMRERGKQEKRGRGRTERWKNAKEGRKDEWYMVNYYLLKYLLISGKKSCTECKQIFWYSSLWKSAISDLHWCDNKVDFSSTDRWAFLNESGHLKKSKKENSFNLMKMGKETLKLSCSLQLVFHPDPLESPS